MILYTEEVFPTAVKNVAIGFYFGFGLCGGVVAPFYISFSNKLNVSPVGMFGVIGIINIFLILKMKETLGKPIWDQIKEIERRVSSFKINDILE